MLTSRVLQIAVIATLFVLGSLTVLTVYNNAKSVSTRLSFSELRLLDTKVEHPDRHDANVLRYVQSNTSGNPFQSDRHDRNVMRYIIQK